MKNLFVMRHAQAQNFGPSDHQRPLTDRGVKQARSTNTWLNDEIGRISCALVSDSTRTIETSRELTVLEHVQITNELYGADMYDIIECISEVSETCLSLLILAHNPGVSHFVHHAGVASHLDTADCVRFSFPGMWSEIELSRLIEVSRFIRS